VHAGEDLGGIVRDRHGSQTMYKFDSNCLRK
jgi:hypothetical protein